MHLQRHLIDRGMPSRLTVLLVALLAVPAGLWPAGVVAAEPEAVNIYSARKEALILPLLERFEAATGIGFRLVTGKADSLLKRLEVEGKLSPADVFISTDAGRLARAKHAEVLQAVSSDKIAAAVPQNLRDADNHWFGLSLRARTIVYAKDRVKPEDLTTYEGLADARWKGRVCVRSSSNIYNQSLVASMIVARGVEATEAWARALVANFARPPAGGDTDQLLAVAAGQCDVALANTYYLGRMVTSKKADRRAASEQLAVFWPNQEADGRGVHVNVSGIGVTRHARHVAASVRLIEFLLRVDSQAWYAEVNNEYPVVAGVPASKTLQAWGEFAADDLNLTSLGENNASAVKLMDRAGWR